MCLFSIPSTPAYLQQQQTCTFVCPRHEHLLLLSPHIPAMLLIVSLSLSLSLSLCATTIFVQKEADYPVLRTSFASLCNVAYTFLPRDALVHSAVLRLHVVRLSVCPSVTLVDQDHIGWKSWKLIARSIRPTPSLFVAQRPSI